MTALQVYAILNKKINGVASGVASHRVEGTDLILTFTDGTSATISFPTPKDNFPSWVILISSVAMSLFFNFFPLTQYNVGLYSPC